MRFLCKKAQMLTKWLYSWSVSNCYYMLYAPLTACEGHVKEASMQKCLNIDFIFFQRAMNWIDIFFRKSLWYIKCEKKSFKYWFHISPEGCDDHIGLHLKPLYDESIGTQSHTKNKATKTLSEIFSIHRHAISSLFVLILFFWSHRNI